MESNFLSKKGEVAFPYSYSIMDNFFNYEYKCDIKISHLYRHYISK